MRKLECKKNDMFGYWKVIDSKSMVKGGHTYVEVQCKCGKIQISCLSDLVNKRTTGCKSCKAQDKKRPIKIGEVYKEWEVIDGPKISSYHSVMWKVRCIHCNTTVRWIQGNELAARDRCFCCQKCASKKMIRRTTKERGRIGDLTKNRYSRLQRIAKTRGIEFKLSIRELWDLFIEQNKTCSITGDYIGNISDASLDRIDSSKGYITGNVQWVTKQANLSKHLMSMKELIDFCQKVLNYANQQPN